MSVSPRYRQLANPGAENYEIPIEYSAMGQRVRAKRTGSAFKPIVPSSRHTPTTDLETKALTEQALKDLGAEGATLVDLFSIQNAQTLEEDLRCGDLTFLGPFTEQQLIRYAYNYEQATRQRQPPVLFPPLPSTLHSTWRRSTAHEARCLSRTE
jgi:hypothetical protein